MSVLGINVNRLCDCRAQCPDVGEFSRVAKLCVVSHEMLGVVQPSLTVRRIRHYRAVAALPVCVCLAALDATHSRKAGVPRPIGVFHVSSATDNGVAVWTGANSWLWFFGTAWVWINGGVL